MSRFVQTRERPSGCTVVPGLDLIQDIISIMISVFRTSDCIRHVTGSHPIDLYTRLSKVESDVCLFVFVFVSIFSMHL